MPNVGGWFSDFFGWLLGRTKVERAERAWKNSLLAVVVLGGLALIAYAASQPAFWPVFGGGVLVAAASGLVGGFGGLIFGLPRYATPTSGGQSTGAKSGGPAARTPGGQAAQNQPPATASPGGQDNAAKLRRVVPNTNLVEVSDWLTKIIVGLGLTQLGSIPGDFQRLVDYARPALGSPPAPGPIVGALIVGYAITGFILTYLFSRLDLELEMDAAEATQDVNLQTLSDLSDLHAMKVVSDDEFAKLKQAVIDAFFASLPKK